MAQTKEEYGKVVKFVEAKNAEFLRACEWASIPPTKRQASKWLSRKGLAYQTWSAIGGAK